MSSKFSRKKTNETVKLSRSDADFFRMSSLFFILCAVILFIFKVMGTADMRISTGENLPYELFKLFNNPVYIAIISLLTAAAIVWTVFCKVKKKDETRKIITSKSLLAVMLYIVCFSYFYGSVGRTNPNDSAFFAVFTVVISLLYYISKIYNRDFLVFSAENALLALLLFRYGAVSDTKGIIGKILLIIAFAAIGAVFVYASKKNKSRLSSAKQHKFLTVPYFLSLAIWAAAMFICGAGIISAGLLLSVFLVQYIIFAIIYTIRLIKE